MKVERINMTEYANIYAVIDEAGKKVGTVEVVLAGRNVGTYAESWDIRYSKRDIRNAYRAAMNG